jgi:hypothetical protein
MKLTKEMIDGIFGNAEDQAHALIELYKIPHPNWDKIKSISGFPRVSPDTCDYIFKKAIAFDKENHPDVTPGGLFLNKGFGNSDEIPNWTVVPAKERY